MHQTLHDLFVDVVVNGLALWQKFYLNNFMNRKETISITLIFDLNSLIFLGLGNDAIFYLRLCYLVRGSYLKICDLLLTTTLLSIAGSVSSFFKMPWHICASHFFAHYSATLVPFLHIFLILRSYVVYTLSSSMLNLSAIILTVR